MTGHKKKPILIVVFSIIYLLNPIGNFLFAIFLSNSLSADKNSSELFRLMEAGNIIVILNFIFWFLAIPLSYGLFKVRAWAWYYFLFYSIAMVILSLFGSDYKVHFSPATVINLIFLIPIGYFISKEVRAVYFNPRLRWWEQSKRFIHEIKIEIENKIYSTFDISETGSFVIDNKELNLELNELVPIVIDLDDKKINCYGQVRWINDQKNKYPMGYGLKFEKLGLKDKIDIRNFLKMLQEEGKKEHK